ncbi:MAG: hypothetical protein ACKOEH_04145, partial [Actinomycetota bacterium]
MLEFGALIGTSPWGVGRQVEPTSSPTEPESVKDGTAASVLGEAEAIINAMAEDIAAELKEKKNKKKKRKRK